MLDMEVSGFKTQEMYKSLRLVWPCPQIPLLPEKYPGLEWTHAQAITCVLSSLLLRNKLPPKAVP